MSRCAPFVEKTENLRLLDAIGHRYGSRPSAILGIDDEWLAYQLDLSCLVAASQNQESRIQNRESGGYGSLKGLARKAKVPDGGVW